MSQTNLMRKASFMSCATASISMLVFSTMSGPVMAQLPDPPPRLTLEVMWEPVTNTETFTVDGKKFASVRALKKFLAKQPEGSIVEWDPGCVRIGDQPLLSSKRDMDDFRQFLKKQKLKLVVIPAG